MAEPRAEDAGTPSAWVIGTAWTALLALAWVVLTLDRPTSTFHLVPLLLAGSWPLLVAQGPRPDRSAARQVLVAGGLGLAVALVVTTILGATDRLEGRGFLGGDHAIREALVLAVLGAALGVLTGLGLLRRRSSAK